MLGPALARLKQTFPSREAYHDWWRAHPAFAHADVAEEDLLAYADHDLVGEPPELRSSVGEDVVRADAAELLEIGKPAHRLQVRTELLCAERGMLDDPNPLQPPAIAEPWADAAPEIRRTERVPGVNHYTIVMGAAGAGAVARQSCAHCKVTSTVLAYDRADERVGDAWLRGPPPEPHLTPKEMVGRAVALRPALVAEQEATEQRTYYSAEMHEAFLTRASTTCTSRGATAATSSTCRRTSGRPGDRPRVACRPRGAWAWR